MKPDFRNKENTIQVGSGTVITHKAGASYLIYERGYKTVGLLVLPNMNDVGCYSHSRQVKDIKHLSQEEYKEHVVDRISVLEADRCEFSTLHDYLDKQLEEAMEKESHI